MGGKKIGPELTQKEREKKKKEDALRLRDLYPTEEEKEKWADEETKRRKKWMDGPDEDDKNDWALRELARREFAAPSDEDYSKEEALEILKDAEKRRDDMVSAAQGLVSSTLLWVFGSERPLTFDGEKSGLVLTPFVIMEQLIKTGKKWKEDERIRKRITDD